MTSPAIPGVEFAKIERKRHVLWRRRRSDEDGGEAR
jgi:hypothetical protein